MTDTAVDLAFLLGNLSNAEESIRLLLGDAFTFIPEEDGSGRLGARIDSTTTTKESLAVVDTKAAEEVKEGEESLPEIALDFEESDYYDVPLKVINDVADEEIGYRDDSSAGHMDYIKSKQLDEGDDVTDSTHPSRGAHHLNEEAGTGEASLQAGGVDDDFARDDGIGAAFRDGAGGAKEEADGVPFPFNINDGGLGAAASSSASLKGLSPFSSIGFMSSPSLDGGVGGGNAGSTTTDGGESVSAAALKPTLNFIGSIFLPNEFSNLRSTQSRDGAPQEATSASAELLHPKVLGGPFLPKEVFTSPYLLGEPGDFASTHNQYDLKHEDGNLTSKSAGGGAPSTSLHSGAIAPGWSTGRNAQVAANNGQTPSSAAGSRVMSFQKAQCFKTRQCRFWLDGRCTRGDECTFAHCGNELREKPNLVKTKICSKWKLGHCSKQQHQCSYAHGLEDLRVLPSAVGGPLTPKAQVAYNDFGF